MSKTRKKQAKRSARSASAVERADVAIATEAIRLRDHPVTRGVSAAAQLADQPPLMTICAATIAAGLLLRRPRLARTGLRMLANELIATGIKHIVKRQVDRTRPNKMIEDGRYGFTRSNGGESDGAWSSFPSGHTAGAVTVGLAIARELPAARPAVGLVAASVGAAQLPSGAHFASDVAAGAAIGVIADAIVGAAIGTAAAAGREPD